MSSGMVVFLVEAYAVRLERPEGCIYFDHAADLGFVSSARHGQAPLVYDLTGSTSGLRRGHHPRRECLRLKNPPLRGSRACSSPCGRAWSVQGPIRE